jgi:uncharacterized protein YqjF (DUF2071 family)
MTVESAEPSTAASVLPRMFLRAGWQHLAMLNFAADPAVLHQYVPAGTELDLWQGHAYLSIVGFQFLGTRVRGIPVPFHRNFEEVNLRMYVRRRATEGWRRGVVFIKEIVPRRLIALIARWLYNENYVAMPMRHQVALPTADASGSVRYEWWHGGRWHSLSVEIAGEPQPLAIGSEEEFITEHYWGYCRQRSGSTLEYRVEHPSWLVWTAANSKLDCDVPGVYGAAFAPFLSGPPASAFVAAGSPIGVRRGTPLHHVAIGAGRA